MYEHVKQIILSGVSGALATSTYLLSGHILDFYMNPKYSNVIALLIGAIFNFILQSRVFLPNAKFNQPLIIRYVISEILIMFLCQWGVIYFIDHKDHYIKKLPKYFRKYYNTVARSITSMMVFVAVSFHLRKQWVFVP